MNMENKIKAILDSNMHFAGLELISFNQSKAIADIVNLIREEKSKVINEYLDEKSEEDDYHESCR